MFACLGVGELLRWILMRHFWRGVQISVRPGTKPGDCLVVPGEGMPIEGGEGAKGNLVVEVNVRDPCKPRKEEEEELIFGEPVHPRSPLPTSHMCKHNLSSSAALVGAGVHGGSELPTPPALWKIVLC